MTANKPEPVTTKPQIIGGRTMKRKRGIFLRKNYTSRQKLKGRREVSGKLGFTPSGWKEKQPRFHDRTVMLKRCGRRCFLGPKKSFPICSRNTCTMNRKGVFAAYVRAREYMTLRKEPKYRRIARTAKRLLQKTPMKK